MHFCKANNGCTGSPFELQRLTDEEQEIQNQLNSILVNDSEKAVTIGEADTNQNEAFTVFDDGTLKVKELMNESVKFEHNVEI